MKYSILSIFYVLLLACSLHTHAQDLSWQASNDSALYYYGFKSHEKALNFAKEAKKALPNSDSARTGVYNTLGYIFVALGQYDSAENYFEGSKQLSAKNWGRDQVDYALGLNNLGNLYQKKELFKQAIAQFDSSLQIIVPIWGKSSRPYITVLHNRARSQEAVKRYPEAEEDYLTSIALARPLIPTADFLRTDLAYIQEHTGQMYRDWGNLDEAKHYFEEALENFMLVLGEESDDYARVSKELANLFPKETHTVEVSLQQAHIHRIVDMQFTRDKRYLLSADIGGRLKYWDVITDQLVRSFELDQPTFLGHRISVSPDGEKVMSNGTDFSNTSFVLKGEMATWDLQNGKSMQLNRVKDAQTISSEEILTAYGPSIQDSLYVKNVYEFDFQSGLKFSYSTLQYYHIGDSSFRQNSLELIKPISEIEISPQGNFLGIGYKDGTLEVWSLPQMELLETKQGAFTPVKDIQFHPQEDWVYVLHSSTLMESLDSLYYVPQKQIWGYQILGENSKNIQGDKEDLQSDLGITDFALSPEGSLLAFAYGNKRIACKRTDNYRTQSDIEFEQDELTALSFRTENELWIASIDSGGNAPQIFAWNVRAGQNIRGINQPSLARDRFYIQPGWNAAGDSFYLYVPELNWLQSYSAQYLEGQMLTPLAYFSQKEGESIPPSQAFVDRFSYPAFSESYLLALHPQGAYATFRESVGEPVHYNPSEYPDESINDLSNWRARDVVCMIDAEGKTIEEAYRSLVNPYTAFSPDGRYWAYISPKQELKVYDLVKGTYVYSERYRFPECDQPFFFGEDTSLYLLFEEGKIIPNPLNTNPLYQDTATVIAKLSLKSLDLDILLRMRYSIMIKAFALYQDTLAYAVYNDPTVYIKSLTTGYMIRRLSGASSEIWGLALKGNKCIAICRNGLNVLWNLQKPEEPLQMLAKENGQTAFVTRAGAYMMPYQRGPSLLSFRMQGANYPIEQFDVQLNRPDRVLEQWMGTLSELSSKYAEVYKNRLKTLKLSPGEFPLAAPSPVLSIENLEEFELSSTDAKISLDIHAKDSLHKLLALQIWVNDVSYTKVKIPLKNVWDQSLEIPLSYGSNKIQVACVNERGVRSLTQTLYVSYLPPIPPTSNLYVIAIGVSAYSEEGKDLQFAAKDATDIVELFKKRGQGIDIEYKLLTDAQFQEQNVLELKEWLASHTSVHDQVIIFYSGHGLRGKDNRLYLTTSETDFSQPAASAIPYDSLQYLLAYSPARQKLLLLDACSSGEFIPGVENPSLPVQNDILERLTAQNKSAAYLKAYSYFPDLRRETGATIISSSRSYQNSAEDVTWKNGAFTKLLIEGVQSLKADLNSDAQITVSEMQQYMLRELPRLTQDIQNPTFRRENLVVDFRLW